MAAKMKEHGLTVTLFFILASAIVGNYLQFRTNNTEKMLKFFVSLKQYESDEKYRDKRLDNIEKSLEDIKKGQDRLLQIFYGKK